MNTVPLTGIIRMQNVKDSEMSVIDFMLPGGTKPLEGFLTPHERGVYEYLV